MKSALRKIAIVLPCLLLLLGAVMAEELSNATAETPSAKAAVIICKGMIDDGLFKSIQRRTQIALDSGVQYLIYEIQTYGGLVNATSTQFAIPTRYLLPIMIAKHMTAASPGSPTPGVLNSI